MSLGYTFTRAVDVARAFAARRRLDARERWSRDELAAFQLRPFEAGSRQVDAVRAAWLFDRNPCRTDDATRDMWVCRRDGAIVGQQAEIPFDLRVGEIQTLITGYD